MTSQTARDPSLAGLSAYHDRITGDILILGDIDG